MNILWVGFGRTAEYFCEFKAPSEQVIGISRSDKPSYKNLDAFQHISFDVGKSDPKDIPDDIHVMVWGLPPSAYETANIGSMCKILKENVPIVFVSSTSVYGHGLVDESSQLEPKSDGGSKLVELERFVQNLERAVCILRPGGLLDESSHPGDFLSQKPLVEGAESPVNVTHRKDLARAIHWVIRFGYYDEVFNILSDTHSMKQSFYTSYMKRNNLPIPAWSNVGSVEKIVSNKKSKDFGFDYFYEDL